MSLAHSFRPGAENIRLPLLFAAEFCIIICMNELKREKLTFRGWFRLCPVRHCLALAGGLVIAAYFALRGNTPLMAAVCRGFVRPWHRFFSRLTAAVPFSVAELLLTLAVLAALAYLVIFVVRLIRRGGRVRTVYRFFATAVAAFAVIYGGFCLLWGVYYYGTDFEAASGVAGEPASPAQLETVTRWFTDLANEYGAQVQRNGSGEFAENPDAVFDRSASLYDAVESVFPCLAGDDVPAKPFFFSRAMSYINFTGFFFPFTAEANINTDSPAAFVPSTIAHEIAHQRGVAPEDEANFCAVAACLENGDPVYCYSAALMAYVYLGNALYSADYDAWAENYERLSPGVRADLHANNAYWAQFETPVNTVSDAVYTGFLKSYGQSDGLQTYGKCVDLLIAYYYNIALEALS